VAGLGIDIEYVARFAGCAHVPSTAFARQVFSARERSAWNGPAAAALAFTVKEAIAKALGTGLCLRRGPGVPCRDIEALVDLTTRSVAVELQGAAAARAARLGAWRGSAWCWCDANVACTIAALLGGNGDSASIDAGLARACDGLESDRRMRRRFVADGRAVKTA
jgi:phosphopantetheine--protein transferase-like protein